MRAIRWSLVALIASFAFMACGAEPSQPSHQSTDEAGAAAAMKLRNPRMPEFNVQAPDTFRARFETTKGDFVVEVHRDWAPRGADRFYNLVHSGYFSGVRFFRVINNFMVQFGIHGDPAIGNAWLQAPLKDDPVKQTNTRGRITFATAGPNTRSVQVFINYVDNAYLDAKGFAPFGDVIEGMDVVDSLYKGYGKRAADAQQTIMRLGNRFLDEQFPDLDEIKSASIVD